MPDVELAPVRDILRAITTTLIPESASLDERAWKEVESVIGHALTRRDQRVQRQLIAFMRVLQNLPRARYGRPLTALSPARRLAFLESVERSRLLLVRRGFWGVRTLVFMGYYTRDDVAESIGYHASVDGWHAHGGTGATIPLAPALWIEP